MTLGQIHQMLKSVPGWEYKVERVQKHFQFRNHHETMAFINAIAWITHREDHHPDITVGYNTATVAYMTHAIHGISENDFICAAKIDALFAL